jgi:hypothetical protein
MDFELTLEMIHFMVEAAQRNRCLGRGCYLNIYKFKQIMGNELHIQNE